MVNSQRTAGEIINSLHHISFGDVVQAWRKSYGWSPTEFAKRAGLTKGHLSEIEHNKIRQPRDEQLNKIAAALGITYLDLHLRRLPTDQDQQKQSPESVGQLSRQHDIGSYARLESLMSELPASTQHHLLLSFTTIVEEFIAQNK